MANRLALELVADTNPLQKGMKQAQDSIHKFIDASEEAGQAIGGTLGGAIDKFVNFSKGGATAAGILAGGFAAAAAGAATLAISAGNQIEELDRLSQKTGIAISTLQGWSVVMAENNFDAQTLAQGMTKLGKKVVDAKAGVEKASESFEAMGLKVEELGSTETIIKKLAEKFSQMADGPEKAALAVDLLGESGLRLLPVLNKGIGALEESIDKSEKYAGVLRKFQITALEGAADAAADVGVALDALKAQLGAAFAPAVIWAAQQLADAIGWMAQQARDAATAVDTLGIRVSHFELAVSELASVAFSKDILNLDAWKQALANIKLIDEEAAKLIAKRRALAETPDAAGSSVALSASASASAKAGKAAKATPFPGGPQDEHIKAFQEIKKLQEEYRLGAIRLHNEETAKIKEQIGAYFETEKAINFVTQEEVDLAAQVSTGAAIVKQSQIAWQHRNDDITDAIQLAQVASEAQAVMYQQEQGAFQAAEIARLKAFDLLEKQATLKRRLIDEEIQNEYKKQHAIMMLELELDAKRRQIIMQYPTFFEQQMQAIVSSNSFSIAQISNTWTSGLANAAVNGGNFIEQAWKSTQVAVLQGLINFGVQKAAMLALQFSYEAGLMSAAAATQVGINTAKNATIVAGDTAAAVTTVSVWEGAAAAITGSFAVMTSAIAGFFTSVIVPTFVAVGEAVATFLTAMATSLDISIFGAAFSVPVWAAVGLIIAATAAIAAFSFGAFAQGGIVTGPTMGMVGEGGSNEAIIPLNSRGAGFMRDVMGGVGGGQTTVIVELDKRVLTRAVFDGMPSVMRVRGMSA